MNPPRKLTSQHQTQAEAELVHQQQSEQAEVKEFATPEAMLRHDALRTPVPPAIAVRLRESVAQIAPPRRSWWQRLFGA